MDISDASKTKDADPGTRGIRLFTVSSKNKGEVEGAARHQQFQPKFGNQQATEAS